MKKQLFSFLLLFALTCIAMNTEAQTFVQLWNKADQAARNDLPKSEVEQLDKIVKKAKREHAYGQLLKAELRRASVLSSVSPDSLLPAVEQLVQFEEETTDQALQAVYDAVLGSIYRQNPRLDDDARDKALQYHRKAVSHPEALARVKATDYTPFVVVGKDSRYFGNDLLSVIGYETEQFQPLHDYYEKAGNREGTLLTALQILSRQPKKRELLATSAYLHSLDSLIHRYADLPEAGEAAIERYHFMNAYTEATPQQKIDYIDMALQRWGAWKTMNRLRNARRDLTARQFYVVKEKEVELPNREHRVLLHDIRGIQQLTMRLYKVRTDGNTDMNPETDDGYKRIKPLLSKLSGTKVVRTYEGRKEYELFEDTISLPPLPAGVYMMEFDGGDSEKLVARKLFFVSDVRLLVQALPKKQIRYVAVSATSGQPLPKAKIHLYGTFGPITTLTTDEKGEFVYDYKNTQHPSRAFATYGRDKASKTISAYGDYYYQANRPIVNNVCLYTDRDIYRPGQTVHVGAILYSTQNCIETQVRPNERTSIQLRDANGRLVSETEVTTDEYGTCSAVFALPTVGLTGHCSVSVNGSSRYFWVEEYKRPTFQVTFEPVDLLYKKGDTLRVAATAKSYSGMPVQGARVAYKVVRRAAFWWMSYLRHWNGSDLDMASGDVEVMSAEAVTDGNGRFEALMPMVVPETQASMFYNFVVTADVTDAAGETRQAQLSLPLGNREKVLSCDLPAKMLSEKSASVTFRLLNAAGSETKAKLRYRWDGGKWLQGNTGVAVALPKAVLKSGSHQVEAVCEEDTIVQHFTMFSLDDKRPATDTDDWFYVSDSRFPSDGQPVTVQVGSSREDIHIVYNIFAGNKVVEQGAVDKSNELTNRKLVYREEYGNGILLTFAWVRDGVTYTHQAKIERPVPDKKLKLQWTTFRNRLTPGQSEEWTLSISKPDGTPADAQLMATLYDKSLDQLTSHTWSLEPYLWLPLPSAKWQYATSRSLYLAAYHHQGNLSSEALKFSEFDHSLYPFYYTFRRSPMLYATSSAVGTRSMNRKMAKGRAFNDELDFGRAGGDVEETAVEVFSAAASNDMADEAVETEEERTDEETATVEMRENLQETAFFYPQMAADSTGRVTLKFTLPESLTTWHFVGIAHTADMMHGILEDEAVASKEVMLQPNVPRFLRTGDRAAVSARIFNTGSKAVDAVAELVLTDAETEKVVLRRQQTVALTPDSTAAVAFSVDAKGITASLLICKMTVRGEGFSDGEQHYLPVLPNRERVTVTQPFTMNGPGTKTIDLSNMVPVKKGKLTFEYTNNPAWLMLQALPVLGHPADDCAVCQAASYYSNALASHLVKQNLRAKHVFEQWKKEGGEETSLQSQLEKNQQLKELVLSETPWVADADRESEQKQRLADFFDDNLMEHRLAKAVEKLGKLQLPDGSWSWWPGMEGSASMTITVSEMLVRLQAMAGQQSDVAGMLDKAFSFMDNFMVKEVKEMQKEEKKGRRQVFPGHRALQYLYLCTIDGRTHSAKVAEAHAYLKKLLKKERQSQTIYEKALAAIVLDSKTYAKSLLEYTVYREDMGRYYDAPRAAYSWRDYRIPTQTMAMEAIQRLMPEDTVAIGEMRRWLLQQKRTQAWDTPLNSVDAVYAFLNGNSRVLAPQTPARLLVDGKPVDVPTATAGIGYVKTSMPSEGKRVLTVKKSSEGTSWGAVYGQFMQATSDVADQSSSGIKVKREIIPSAKNAQKGQLRVGERVTVRITIVADRDLDFVQVVDRRAACMEPVSQLSGYRNGSYRSTRDQSTNYYFSMLPKGKHVLETEYYLDREGTYQTGTCVVQCAYAPEFSSSAHSQTITVSR